MNHNFPQTRAYMESLGFHITIIQESWGPLITAQKTSSVLTIYNHNRDCYCYVQLSCNGREPIDLQYAALGLGAERSRLDELYWKRESEDLYMLHLCSYILGFLGDNLSCDAFESLETAAKIAREQEIRRFRGESDP